MSTIWIRRFGYSAVLILLNALSSRKVTSVSSFYKERRVWLRETTRISLALSRVRRSLVAPMLLCALFGLFRVGELVPLLLVTPPVLPLVSLVIRRMAVLKVLVFA